VHGRSGHAVASALPQVRFAVQFRRLSRRPVTRPRPVVIQRHAGTVSRPLPIRSRTA
jgi:hypothetical protein